MELYGSYKLKAMMGADENGVKLYEGADLEALAEEDGDIAKMLKAEFILSESAIDVYYMPTEEEMPMVEEEGWEMTDKGVLIDSYPAKIENGTVLLDYERDGSEYTPVETDENNCLIIGDMMKIEKV